MKKLKNCPFCGSDNIVIENYEDQIGGTLYNGVCIDCFASSGSAANETTAIILWNNREGRK